MRFVWFIMLGCLGYFVSAAIVHALRRSLSHGPAVEVGIAAGILVKDSSECPATSLFKALKCGSIKGVGRAGCIEDFAGLSEVEQLAILNSKEYPNTELLGYLRRFSTSGRESSPRTVSSSGMADISKLAEQWALAAEADERRGAEKLMTLVSSLELGQRAVLERDLIQRHKRQTILALISMPGLLKMLPYPKIAIDELCVQMSQSVSKDECLKFIDSLEAPFFKSTAIKGYVVTQIPQIRDTSELVGVIGWLPSSFDRLAALERWHKSGNSIVDQSPEMSLVLSLFDTEKDIQSAQRIFTKME